MYNPPAYNPRRQISLKKVLPYPDTSEISYLPPTDSDPGAYHHLSIRVLLQGNQSILSQTRQ